MKTMNSKTIIYKDVDRIIRIIYKEIGYQKEFGRFLDKDDYFNLSSPNFKRVIKTKYIELYPANYNEDDLENILVDLEKQLTDKFQSTNSIYLIVYISDMILKHNLNRLFVDFEDLLEWDGFINKIDSKLFVAAKLAKNNIPLDTVYGESVIYHNNYYIYDLCQRTGLSENHMHLQASGYITDINWYSFLEKDIFNRIYFDEFIKSQGIYKGIPKTEENVKIIRNNILKVKCLRVILSNAIDSNGAFYQFSLSERILDELMDTDDVEAFCQNEIGYKPIDDSYGSLADIFNISKEINIIDKLKTYPDYPLKYSLIEIEFLKELFDKLINKQHKQIDKQFIYLFNSYICGMTSIKFQFLQDNLGMGFSKFKEKEDNKKWFITNHQKDVNKSCFHKYYREKNINNIELRVGPWDTGEGYIKLIEDLNKCNREEWQRVKVEQQNPLIKKINFGLIIHFIKLKHLEGESFVDEMILKRKTLEDQGNAILNALFLIDQAQKNELDNRNLINKIVGIDTANYEEDNRPNLYGCVFRKLRYDTSVSQVLYATYHVGEEFPTLTNGLRAIDEVLMFCAYRSNDRLGHALALGIDSKEYYKVKRNSILCSFEDYLDDIVWMYKMLIESPYSADKKYLPYLKGEFDMYSHVFFSDLYPVDKIPNFEVYFDAYILRGDDPMVYLDIKKKGIFNEYNQICQRYGHRINSHDSNHKMAFSNQKARDLYFDYSFDEAYRLKATEPFKTPITEMYGQVVDRVQHLLKEKILSLHVFIEANPTSNKKISYIKHYSNLPALKLNSYPIHDCQDKIHLPISINTDDSSIFQTNLTNEYSMIAAALIREGYQEQVVYAYLEQLAIASNVHSFIEK